MGRDQRGQREISQLIKISDQDLERGCQLRLRCKMYDLLRVMREEEEEGEGGGGDVSCLLTQSIDCFVLSGVNMNI